MKRFVKYVTKGHEFTKLNKIKHAEIHANHGFERAGKRDKNIYKDIFVCP